jgi:hypothetical protein
MVNNVQQLGVHPDEIFHWRTHQGAAGDAAMGPGLISLPDCVSRQFDLNPFPDKGRDPKTWLTEETGPTGK